MLRPPRQLVDLLLVALQQLRHHVDLLLLGLRAEQLGHVIEPFPAVDGRRLGLAHLNAAPVQTQLLGGQTELAPHFHDGGSFS